MKVDNVGYQGGNGGENAVTRSCSPDPDPALTGFAPGR
jgi:hypothetical protein